MDANKYCKFYLIVILILIQQQLWSGNFVSIGPTISSGSKSLPINGRFGLGGSLEYVHGITKHGGLRVTVGYDYFKHRYPATASQDSLLKLEASGHGTNTLLPVRVGYQYSLFDDVAFVYGEVGIAVLHRPTYNGRYNLTKSLFTYAVGFGRRFTISQSQVIQLSVFYNYNKLYENSNLNYFSLRAAYGFKLSKGKSRVSI